MTAEDGREDGEQFDGGFIERADTYDDWFQMFQGAVEQQVDWQLLEPYLPASRDARILDAAGGTGRITLPLAQMGYAVTLSDISSGMLDVARPKLARHGVLDRVEVVECDNRALPFTDETFDFVLCWDGGLPAVAELARVTRRGGGLSVAFVNQCGAAVDRFRKDPASALALLTGTTNYVEYDHSRHRVTNPEQARAACEAAGLHVIETIGMWGWLEALRIPKDVLESREWDEEFFRQTVEMVLRLAREPSVQGMAMHLHVYARKT